MQVRKPEFDETRAMMSAGEQEGTVAGGIGASRVGAELRRPGCAWAGRWKKWR